MKLFKKTAAVMLCLSLMPAAAFADGVDEKRTIDITLISDSHLASNALYGTNDYARESVIAEMRLEVESEAILDKALGEAADSAPDVLLHCGDLTGNGEYVNMELIRDKLDAFRAKSPDTGIFVTDGNHDINNSYAYDFSSGKPVPARRVLPSDFRAIFKDYGFGDDSELYDASSNDAGSLSYVTDIADGITLITLDTCKYSDDTSALYGDAQETGGALSEELLSWAAEKAKAAKEKGNLVLAMCHHSIVKHYTVDNRSINTYMKSFTIENWEHIADTLADAGVTAVFTGHKHNDDAAMHVSPDGNVIYDIATPSLVEYPCAYKTVHITDNGSGSYEFNTDTHYINSVTYTDPETSEETTINDLQAYSVNRSGFNKDMVVPAANHLLTEKMYSIQKSENGLKGFIADGLKCAPDRIGAALVQKLLDLLPPEGEAYTIDNPTVESVIGKASLYRENNLIICENTVEAESLKCKIKIHVDELARMLDQAVDTLDAELTKADLTKVHEPSEVQKEIVELVASILIPTLNTPMQTDSGSVTGFDILSDAYNTFGIGNEAFASAELRAKRAEWRELVMGEDFATNAGCSFQDTVTDLLDDLNISKDDPDEVAGLETSKYKLLQKALLSVSVDMDKVITVEGDETMLPMLLDIIIGKPDNLGALIYRIWDSVSAVAFSSINNSVGRFLGGILSESSEAMTTDENMPEDINTVFRTGNDTKLVTAEYEQEGTDFRSKTETDNIASLWKLTVAPGSEPLTSLNVRVNGHKAAESDFETPSVTDGQIVVGIVVNHAGDEINSITAIVNGTSTAAVRR